MVYVVLVNLENDRLKQIDDEKYHLDDAQDPEEDHVKSFGLAVDMEQYQVDDSDADDQVIHIKICISDHEDGAVEGAGHAVALEDVDVCNAVEHGDGKESHHEAALKFTARQTPASRYHNDDEDRYADQIGNINGLHVDCSFHNLLSP